MSDQFYRRRALLRAAGAAGTVGLAGCLGGLTGGNGDGGDAGDGDGFNPITPGGRELAGTSISEMPDLSGTIDVYSGRGEALVGGIISFLEDQYPDVTLNVRYDTAAALANRIINEGDNSAADVFFTVNAGALGTIADEGRAVELPPRVLDLVRDEFHDPNGQWTGISGRVRSIAYNSESYSESGIPDDIFAFPENPDLAGNMGWAPSYSSFQGFITAMRLLNGREQTRAWLEAMLDAGIQEYSDEFQVVQAVADGEIAAGFANHYYTLRVQNARPSAPIELAFTQGDAGATFNVAGALVTDTADDPDMAATFVQHLLSAEAQDYFALSRTFEYPVIPELEPIGDLPSLDELNTPDVDLTQLSDLQPTIELLREVGISV